MKVAALVAAAGSGSRMKTATPKQYLLLEGLPVLIRSVALFCRHPQVGFVAVVVPSTDFPRVRDLLNLHLPEDQVHLVAGGASRQESVGNGLQALDDCYELVAIHDGVRPLASPELLDRLIVEAAQRGAAVPVLNVSDTVKEVSAEGRIIATPNREKLRLVQTPQIFRQALIQEAYRNAAERKLQGTDDASLVEALGAAVYTIPGEPGNLKITTADDLKLAAFLLQGGS